MYYDSRAMGNHNFYAMETKNYPFHCRENQGQNLFSRKDAKAPRKAWFCSGFAVKPEN